MGITWCPGCGLGHSIAFLLHGDLRNSFHAHWLGVPALIIILYRIFDLISQRVSETSFVLSKPLYFTAVICLLTDLLQVSASFDLSKF